MALMLNQFLLKSRNLLHSSSSLGGARIHVVLGNESCDLDSVVSAIGLAYYYACSDPSDAVIPVCNTTREIFRLKTEVAHCFTKYGVDTCLLVFAADLELFFRRVDQVRVSLVDHHVPVGLAHSPKSLIYNIVDHHPVAQDNPVHCLGEAKIRAVGSCSTLVAEEILSLGQVDPILATLVYETILLDCGFQSDGSSSNGTEADLRILTKLESLLPRPASSRHRVTEELWRAKCDISDLTLHQILRKDMKEIKSPYRKDSHVSAVPMALHHFLKIDRLESDINLYSTINRLDFLIILPYVFTPFGFVRDVIVHNSLEDRMEKLVTSLLVERHLGLKVVCKNSTMIVLSQGDARYSRKHLLPIFREIIGYL